MVTETDGEEALRCVAFDGDRLIQAGSLVTVARAAKEVAGSEAHSTLAIFNATTSQPVELDLRGTLEDVLARLSPEADGASDTAVVPKARRGPGRPRLGVVSKEVTLLPRHWAWLAAQRGGSSAALRRLVDKARRADAGGDLVRKAQDATYRFMAAMAGNQAGFEEATRALFAADAERFEGQTDDWPVDIRDHTRRLAADALGAGHDTTDGDA
jgi:hypothetical protein